MATVQELQHIHLPAIAPEDFFILLAHITKKEKAFLFAHPEYELSPQKTRELETFLKRRLKHEPIAYITGHKEFYGRDFKITPDTLVPRPETELLVESVLAQIRKNGRRMTDVIDMGTGSGNIIVSIAKEIEKLPAIENFFLSAIDISEGALATARENARRHGVEQRIAFLKSDLFEHYSLPHKKNRNVIIAANLPYLSKSIYRTSSSDVYDYEPESALVSGEQGLDHYRRLLLVLKKFSQSYLETTFFLEISPEQSNLLKEEIGVIFLSSSCQILQDLNGRDRLIQTTL